MGTLKSEIGRHAVHLCIDMQRLFSSEGPWPTPWMERVLPTVVQLVERAPDRTLFTRFLTLQSPNDAGGTWRLFYEKWRLVTRQHLRPELLDLMPALQHFVPPALIFDRPVYSVFADGQRISLHRTGADYCGRQDHAWSVEPDSQCFRPGSIVIPIPRELVAPNRRTDFDL